MAMSEYLLKRILRLFRRLLEKNGLYFLKVFLKRNVSETSKFGFCSSRTAGKRVHRSVGLHGAELWPFEVIRLLEEK